MPILPIIGKLFTTVLPALLGGGGGSEGGGGRSILGPSKGTSILESLMDFPGPGKGRLRRFKDLKPSEISSFLATLGAATAQDVQQSRAAEAAQRGAQSRLGSLYEQRLEEVGPGGKAVLPRGLATERRLSIEDARRRAEQQTFGQDIATKELSIAEEGAEDYGTLVGIRGKAVAIAERAEPTEAQKTSAAAVEKIKAQNTAIQLEITKLKLQKELQPEGEGADLGIFRNEAEIEGFNKAFNASIAVSGDRVLAGEAAMHYLRLVRGEAVDDDGGGDDDGEPKEYVFEGDELKGFKAEGGGVTGEGSAALARQGLYNVAATVGTHFPLTGIPAEIGGALEVVKQRRGRLLYKVTPPVGTVGVQDNLIRLTLEEAEAYRQRNWTIEEAEERRMKTKPSPTYEVRR